MAVRPVVRRLAVLSGVVVVMLGLLIGGLVTFQRSLIYFPDRSTPPAAADVLVGGRDVVTRTADGLDLTSWYVPAPPGCSATVLVAHGNGGHRGYRVDLVRAITGRGFGVLLVGYRGYGGNPGAPSERGLALDARAALGFLTGDAGVPVRQVSYFGESIGAEVVTELALEHPPAAMLLRSPFTSLADVGRAAYGFPVEWFLRDHFPFYADLFDLEPAFTTPGYVAFDLVTGVSFAVWSGVSDAPTPATPRTSEICVNLPGGASRIDELYARWVAKGVTVVAAPHDAPFGRTFVVADPDGNLIRVAPVD